MKVKSESEVTQSCPTLSDPTDCSPPGSSVQGILQARVLEWGAIAFSCVWDECNCVVVWAFFGIPFLWAWNENWPFPFLWPLLTFLTLLAYWVQHFNSIIQHSPVSGCSAVSCNFGVLSLEDECMSFYSAILKIPGEVESRRFLIANVYHFMANRWGNNGNSNRLYFGGIPKSLQMVIAAMKLKETFSSQLFTCLFLWLFLFCIFSVLG